LEQSPFRLIAPDYQRDAFHRLRANIIWVNGTQLIVPAL
jgi:hypothetical protein